MNLFFKKILLGCCLSLVFVCTNGQVSLSTAISPGQVNKDELVSFSIIIENAENIQQLTPPSFKNFVVVSGPAREIGGHSVNGRVTRFVAFTFILKPKHAGNLRIDPAKATIGGKQYKSNPVVLVVQDDISGNTAGVNPLTPLFDPLVQQRPRSDFNDYIIHKGDNIADKINKNMVLKLEVDKTSCYVGEPVVASYNMYTRLKSESQLTQNPSFNGFSVIELQQPDISDYKKQQWNGREYNVYTIRKAQLYALQPGTIALEAAALDNDVLFIKEDYAAKLNDLNSIFDDFAISTFPPDAMVHQKVTLQSKPVSILVKPLPETGKPVSFKGAVGSFTIKAGLQKNKFSTDEAGKLSLTISGSGNMQLLTSPDIEWPSGIEPFEPKVIDELSKLTVPVSGNKTFEYSFAANSPGTYKLPAIHFSYFDPKTAAYRSIATEPISFSVIKGTGESVALSNIPLGHKNISFINKIFSHRWWVIIFIGVVILTGLIIWLMREKKAVAVNSLSQIPTKRDEELNHLIELSALNQQNPLTETEKCLYRDDCAEFYALLNTELKNYLSQKFSIDPNAINSGTVTGVMDKRGISNDIVLQLQHIMQDIEWQLYTPFERNEKMNELYHAAHEVIQQINSYDIRHV